MTKLVRVILTFTNPKQLEFLYLSNLIFKAESLTEQQIFIASPPTELLHYSSDRIKNIKLTRMLSLNDITPELFDKKELK
jgi:hypothetical protein